MPTYDYRCNACSHEFEHFQSINSPVMRKCPECGKLKLERLIGIGAGVIFKGGGFYETDYRSESYRKAAEAEKSGGAASKSDGASPEKTGEKTGEKTADKPGEKAAEKSGEKAGGKSDGKSGTASSSQTGNQSDKKKPDTSKPAASRGAAKSGKRRHSE